MNNQKITMGEKIDDLIKKNNLTSKELSKRVSAAGVKLSEATLSDIINNIDKGYSYKIFVEIATQLNVSLDYLLTDSEVFTTDNELKFVCEYTKLNETSVKLLRYFNEHTTKFINDMVYFAKENEYALNEFFFIQPLLLSLYNKPNEDDKKNEFHLWKQNEMLFTNSQFKIQSAFNKYINGNVVITEASKFYDNVEREYLQIDQKIDKELDLIDKTAVQQGYNFWTDWLDANKNKFEHPVILQEWLLKYNISISDDTANYIMASLI